MTTKTMIILNRLAILILVIFWIISVFIKIDYSISIMYLVLMYISIDEYIIYTKDKKELLFLVPQRKKRTQELLSYLYLLIIIFGIYLLDKFNYLKVIDISPSERLLQIMIWGIILVKRFIYSDYIEGNKFLISGFRSTGFIKEKKNWNLLIGFKIDYNDSSIELNFGNAKMTKVEFDITYDKQRLKEIENYLNEKINVA